MPRTRRVRRQRFPHWKIVYSITGVLIITASLLLVFQLLQGLEFNSISGNKAVIVDQLSVSMPNQTFVNEAVELLKKTGFTVDYYPANKVTIDFYRHLPLNGYKIIILRAHSAVGNRSGSSKFVIFSHEPYSKLKYQYEQLTDRVGEVKVDEGEKSYFGIFPDFVRYSMKGDFHDAVIITMGCGGGLYPDMAKAFIKKGALVYFGWDERVDIDHTDRATICLLRHLLLENETIGEAITNTNKEMGQDPKYNSSFICYGPPSALDAHVRHSKNAL